MLLAEGQEVAPEGIILPLTQQTGTVWLPLYVTLPDGHAASRLTEEKQETKTEERAKTHPDDR